MFKRTLCAAMALVALAPAWAAEWMTDLEAAKAKAAAENKAVLVDFTGSDWCGWCIRLRKQVLDTPAFEQYAKDKFVLMEVDVPQNPKFDKELRARNEKLCDQYGVDGFPTILVLTPQGDAVGGFNGYKPSVAEAAASLDEALGVAALLKKADSQQGAEQLAMLVQAYKAIPSELRAGATGLSARIVALDPQDTSGLRHQQAVEDQRAEFQRTLAAVAFKADAIAKIDKALETAYPENKPGMMQVKFQILLMSAQNVEDVKAAAAAGRAAMEIDPAVTPADKQKFEASFADPEAVLKRMQQLRKRKK
ncbi:MAG: thioredoxin family protein [Akkermansia sp.]|nr:thioredoxin family protein [Akkermansia sp.]